MGKKILFDLVSVQENPSGKRHGGGKYGEIVFKRMIEKGLRPSAFYRSSLWINPDILSIIQKYDLQLHDLDQQSLDDITKHGKVDIIFSCLPDNNLLNISNTRAKVILHGLRKIETPADRTFWSFRNNPFRQKIRAIIDRSMQIAGSSRLTKSNEYRKYFTNPNIKTAVVSEHTANAVKAFFPEFKDLNIPVFYSPSTSNAEPDSSNIPSEKYFLLVSGNRWEKNCLRAVQALDRLFSAGFIGDYKVKITGAKSASIYKYKLQNPDRFEFLGFVSENELATLYKNAYALIYPSLNEGFGYPPLEAMRFGVPVLASPFTSITEVCESAALYFNPYSVEEIMNRIIRLTNSPVLYEDLKQRSLLQYQKITAKQHADLDRLINWITDDL